ncbi:hypothetical protein SODALDRAFT_318871 [Sodiomyces alkalinus F11]|uniref:Cyclase n=1 Tax=Sodiomyces alkalinus (strain CBS 110278 / VKM F-3762 / F11) TaxID=1314773 RepID=A0A3N2Q5S0_SODAK|nr:hypothetical protein SODALDRAFT_318871 [Sodiomyces alkalinus F11]ROT42129.1 hypothetical protein SODALDRAFT_318871 [Sodiomyces alkalinus F11]
MFQPLKNPSLNENGIPPFESLPLQEGDPPYSAWGLYGDKDELGTLNRLTDERVAATAREEIKTGVRISLNWPLDAHSKGSFFSRGEFHQEMFQKKPHVANDDTWTFNTQVSSQWDGLRHVAYQKEELFYSRVTMDELYAVDANGVKSTVNGIQAWQKKGIVGRGILVDYHTWRLGQGIDYDPFARSPIPVDDIKACLKAQGTEVRFGDILFTRTGYMVSHAQKSTSDLAALQKSEPHTLGGLQPSLPALRWLWHNFSAIAGDQPAFECWPPLPDHPDDVAAGRGLAYSIHEVALAGWGCPLGELFDLEALAAHCCKEGRWSFFVASEVCHVPGGVASPPNILAIF